ncbi:MAG: hypothetical protein J7J93_02035, partial [Candidatus Aenigmarchaeota archaeon]|nr:hypothetical protein [Candidatus Aenigmarchaeota archaeon]
NFNCTSPIASRISYSDLKLYLSDLEYHLLKPNTNLWKINYVCDNNINFISFHFGKWPIKSEVKYSYFTRKLSTLKSFLTEKDREYICKNIPISKFAIERLNCNSINVTSSKCIISGCDYPISLEIQLMQKNQFLDIDSSINYNGNGTIEDFAKIIYKLIKNKSAENCYFEILEETPIGTKIKICDLRMILTQKELKGIETNDLTKYENI